MAPEVHDQIAGCLKKWCPKNCDHVTCLLVGCPLVGEFRCQRLAVPFVVVLLSSRPRALPTELPCTWEPRPCWSPHLCAPAVMRIFPPSASSAEEDVPCLFGAKLLPLFFGKQRCCCRCFFCELLFVSFPSFSVLCNLQPPCVFCYFFDSPLPYSLDDSVSVFALAMCPAHLCESVVLSLFGSIPCVFIITFPVLRLSFFILPVPFLLLSHRFDVSSMILASPCSSFCWVPRECSPHETWSHGIV